MELNNTIVLVIVAFVLFVICLYLVERVEGFVGLKLPQFLRYAFAIVLVFGAYQAWQKLPVTYSPDPESSESRPVIYSLPPISIMDCPNTHPVKGGSSTSRSEGCIYRVPGSDFYHKTKPERCYATARDAQQDGCRASNF